MPADCYGLIHSGHRLERCRRQFAIAGHQVRQRLLLAHRQHPPAVDQGAGIHRRDRMHEALPIQGPGRKRLAHQQRLRAFERTLGVKLGNRSKGGSWKNNAAAAGARAAPIQLDRLVQLQIHPLVGQRVQWFDPLRPHAARCLHSA